MFNTRVQFLLLQRKGGIILFFKIKVEGSEKF